MRTRKVVNGVTTEYYLNGSTILTQISGDDRLDFLYDDAGSLLGLKWNGTAYWYVKNLQGDIIGILDSGGNMVVEYLYNAWGQEVGRGGSMWQTLGARNPFRYRGYYYDTESGLYYINSRYYDPEIGRFLNADGYVTTGQGLIATNMFAYCGNNPVMYVDESGLFFDQIGKFFSDVGNAISKTFAKIFNIGKKAVEINYGGGYGIGIKANVSGVAKVELEGIAYGQYYNVSNEGWKTTGKSQASFGVGISDNIRLSAGASYEAPYEEVKQKGIIFAENGKSSYWAGVDFLGISYQAIEQSKKSDAILSYGIGLYAIVGAEGEITVNISEIIREWDNPENEEW